MAEGESAAPRRMAPNRMAPRGTPHAEEHDENGACHVKPRCEAAGAPYVWTDDLLWCPSQCTAPVTAPDGRKALLYLRWRHDDPWTGDIIWGATRLGGHVDRLDWESVPLPFFTDEQLAEAKATLIEAWEARRG